MLFVLCNPDNGGLETLWLLLPLKSAFVYMSSSCFVPARSAHVEEPGTLSNSQAMARPSDQSCSAGRTACTRRAEVKPLVRRPEPPLAHRCSLSHQEATTFPKARGRPRPHPANPLLGGRPRCISHKRQEGFYFRVEWLWHEAVRSTCPGKCTGTSRAQCVPIIFLSNSSPASIKS